MENNIVNSYTEICDLRNKNLTEINFNELDEKYKVIHLEHNNINIEEISNLSNITNIYLIKNNINGTLYLRNLENLIMILLNNNDIKEIIIENCPKLMFLNVSNNINLNDIKIYDCPNISVVNRNPYHLFPSIETLLDEIDARGLHSISCNNYNVKFYYDDNFELNNIQVIDNLNDKYKNFKTSRDDIETGSFNDIKVKFDYDDQLDIYYKDINIMRLNKNPLGKWKYYVLNK